MLHARSSLTLLLLLAVPRAALAEPQLPPLDRFVESEVRRPLASVDDARARSLLSLAEVAHVEGRLGVPTFLWTGARTPSSPSLRALGVTPEQAARRYLFDYAALYRFEPAVLAESPLSHVHDTGFGAVIVSFSRSVQGIPVFRDELRVAMNQRLEPVALSGYLSPLPEPEALDYELDGAQALSHAFGDVAGRALGGLPRATRSAGDWQWFEGRGLGSLARARRVLFGLPDSLEPAWQVEVSVAQPELTSAPTYAYVISGRTGEVLFRKNLTSAEAFGYRVWADSGSRVPWAGPQGNAALPYPAATPVALSPPFTAQSLISLESAPHARSDPWLAPGATETRGNNADVYADLFGPNGFSGGDVRATVTAPGLFDRTYDPSQQPRASTDQTMAAVTQLFYNVNFFRDWFYDHGFDEASGNAQVSNFGRGGLGNDPLLAEAQDYSGTNNANMSVPADGASPRMQMYVFEGSTRGIVRVTAPAALAGDRNAGLADFGAASFSVTGELAAVDDGVGTASDGCEIPYANAAEVAGKVALVDRGNCTFAQKAENAAAQGAVGVVLVNNAGGGPPDMPGGAAAPTVPTLSLSLSDGVALRSALAGGATVQLSLFRVGAAARDGTLDNAIVAHEWGHYISNRLIGNAVGLSNSQGFGLGEGWGDFHALLMLVRDGDAQLPFNANWAGSYAVSTYVTSLSTAAGYYFGVRRVPYSTDFARNALTFRHIADGEPLPAGIPMAGGQGGANNSQFHNTGEVWATMLWECYAALLRETERYTFQEAQRRMQAYLVASYKLTPIAPTLLEARDALLAAAQASSDADFRLFARAFARRGAGMYAVGPDRSSGSHRGVVESFVSGADVVLTSATLRDDVKSCDRDGTLDRGEEGTLVLEVKSSGMFPLEAGTVTVTTRTPGLELVDGATASLGDLAPGKTVTVRVKVALGGERELGTALFDVALGGANVIAEGERLRVVKFRINHDIQAEASASDDVETAQTAWSSQLDPRLYRAVQWGRERLSSGESVWLGPNPSAPADIFLVSPPLKASASAPLVVKFKHRHEFEFRFGQRYYDGGVLELSTDGGVTWSDVGARASPGYGGPLQAQGQNPLAGRSAFVGRSAGYPAFVPVTLSLGTDYAGKTVRLRFRIGSDDASALRGWELDDFSVTGIDNLPFSAFVVDAGLCDEVIPVNQAPTAVASGPASARASTSVVLDGTASSDPEGSALTFSWTQLEGPAVALDEVSSATPRFMAPEVAEQTPVVFELVVSDGALQSAPSQWTVQVEPVEAVAEELMPQPPSGCGCGATPSSSGWLALLALAALARVRRRAR